MIVVVIAGLFALTFLMTPQLSNAQERELIPKEEKGIYILTESVPIEISEYAQKSLGDLLAGWVDITTIKIGSPFKLYRTRSDLYYYIVFSDDDIIGTFRVYEDEGQYSGIFNENQETVDGIEMLYNLTSSSLPARIVAGDYEDLYAVTGSSVVNIVKDSAGRMTNVSTCQTNYLYSVIPESVIDVTERIPIDASHISLTTNPSYKVLWIGYSETQSDVPWCMAYATASIMRYKANKGLNTISAQKVMKWAYPLLPESLLRKTSLSIKKAGAYANTYNVNPIHVSSRRTYAQVANEIQADNPLLFICDNLDTGKKKAHAFVCRGYADNSGNPYYSIWNPWYSKYERMYSDTNTYVNETGSARYKWSETMYNWD